KDKSSMANLRHHAIGCYGQEAVDQATPSPSTAPSGSIFSAFACQGQAPVNVSHRTHSNTELLTTGRSGLHVPSHTTINRDIKASFEYCKDRIQKLLREHPGKLHFATDAWTSPNHHALIAWTVHFEYQGSPLSFLLDILEVPEVRTSFIFVIQ
ncbi:hypothetical protein EI94DRAFT_1640431, partial [Lactarius quietus]